MDRSFTEFIDKSFEKAIKNVDLLTRDDIIRMLSVGPGSEECSYMGSKAREIARIKMKNKAYVGASLGIDYRPCAASCRYCSFGEKWGLMKGEHYVPDESVIATIRDRLGHGYRRFTLRTTNYYDVDRLCALGRKIRSEIPGKYMLSVNTGELTREQADALADSGFDSAYHTLHLREGTDTNFDPEVRISTMTSIAESKLGLTTGIDPIGVEHTNEEIADRIIFLREKRPRSLCAMKRFNPRGTPFEGVEEVDDRRIAQIACVIRFATDASVSAVPISRIAMEWGVTNTSIGTGSNPRDDSHDIREFGKWRSDQDAVRAMFRECGYDIDIPGRPECPDCREYLDSVQGVFDRCHMCGKETDIVSRCSGGHLLCQECTEPVIRSEIKRICLSSGSRNPYEILQSLLDVPVIFGRAVKYHIALPAALATAYRNSSSSEMDLSAVLDEVMRRGSYVPMRACGHWGTCGAAVSCGVFFSTVTGTNPFSEELYGRLHTLTGGCLSDIGEAGGPRCCNRNTLLSLRRTVRFVKEELGVEMEWEDIRCTHQDRNKQCQGPKCPFNPHNGR